VLFGAYQIEKGGSITFEGKDLESEWGIDIRNKLALIPQECYIIEGTLKENLDFHSEFTKAFVQTKIDAMFG
jgi:ABC-type transport system involved in cytochrome bd biosynthesis fused ATPase/permease subunit